MAVSEQLKALVDQMPNPDDRGMFTEKVDKDKIEKAIVDKERIERAIAAIHAGGRENVRGLIEMLGEPGSDQDVKPHYALHCLARHTVIAEDEQGRRALCEVLGEALSGNHSPYIKGFLCQTLQWFGHRESAAPLGKLLTDEQLCDAAAMALVAIKDGAAEQLRAALPKAQGRCRLAIVNSLAALADTGATAALQQALKDDDREVRIAAGAGLAALGDPGAVDVLLKAADVQPGWERIQVTKHCLVLAEKLTAAGKKAEARRIYQHLRDTRKDASEAYIREVVEKALAAA
jgi:HEAT repeat protein